jgi:hypothetical protein
MPTTARARSTRRDARAPAPPAKRAKSKAKSPSKTATTSRRRKAAAVRQQAPAPVAPVGFPAWSDLGAGAKGRKKSAVKKVLAAKARRARFLDTAPSPRFGVWVLAFCIAATLYVGHVFATQETLAALQRAERENLQLHLTRERLQGAYDRMTGPDQILGRAAALGLEEGVAYGPPIHLDPED